MLYSLQQYKETWNYVQQLITIIIMINTKLKGIYKYYLTYVALNLTDYPIYKQRLQI